MEKYSVSGTNNDNRRGGKRPGAGRPAEVKLPRPKTVSLDPATIERAREIGGGNLSAGIRRAVASFGFESNADGSQEIVECIQRCGNFSTTTSVERRTK